MFNTRSGAIQLFRAWGIDVYLHWSWFVIAVVEIQMRSGKYESPLWNVYEYLALFLIVLMHEFGHALACRQVGGQADQIVLWPLGGVAYVRPPQRPGATLWSIAAGPLVNVALLVLSLVAMPVLNRVLGESDLHTWLTTIAAINVWLLVFNILPVYPLDGGQMLRSLLWYGLGRARSLQVATIIGFVGAGLLGLFLLSQGSRSMWSYIILFYLVNNCWQGWRQARALAVLEATPARRELACPNCRVSPPAAPYWSCRKCGQPFDPFAQGAICPHCQAQYAEVWCLECGEWSAPEAWVRSPDV